MLKLHTNSTYQAMITLLTGSWLSWTNFLYAIQRFKGHSLLLTDWKRHRYNRADHTEMHLSKRVQHIHAQEVHGGVLWVQSTAASCKKRQGEHLHSSSNLWLPMARKSRHAPGLYCTCTIGFKGLWWPERISHFNVFGRVKPVYIKLHEGHTTPYTPSPVSEEWVTPRRKWFPSHWLLRIKWLPPGENDSPSGRSSRNGSTWREIQTHQ